MSARSAFLILGDQLFPPEQIPFIKSQPLLMVEDFALCTHFKYHKHKIILFLSAMRNYADQLERSGFNVSYYDGQHELFKSSFEDKLDDFLLNHSEVQELHHYSISDHFFSERINRWAKKKKVDLIEHKSPMFLTSKEQFQEHLSSSKKPFMNAFYISQRKRLDILVDKQKKPIDGQWSFDADNRKKYPKEIKTPKLPKIKITENVTSVQNLVDKEFGDHPGQSEHFWIPTTRRESLKWLDRFIDERLQSFGPYQDAISSEIVFGFHSVISPMMNCGLITPDEVVDRIVEAGRKHDLPISSIEGFVRQVIGWREFVKGIYDNYTQQMNETNHWGHKRKLTKAWYNGSTGIPPLDDSIKRAQRFGYSHHIDRLMVQSNMMLLSEIDPKQVYKWFMEMFVDSADWVMEANVYGMGQMSEGGIFATKPYICGSNYILKMSHYKKGDWCHIMDGLYWRFIHNKRQFFAKNPRMSMSVRTLDRMKPERKELIFSHAEKFLNEYTK